MCKFYHSEIKSAKCDSNSFSQVHKMSYLVQYVKKGKHHEYDDKIIQTKCLNSNTINLFVFHNILINIFMTDA